MIEYQVNTPVEELWELLSKEKISLLYFDSDEIKDYMRASDYPLINWIDPSSMAISILEDCEPIGGYNE